MAIDLRDKPILITGASSGIGRATALACAAAGMPVALAARRIDKLETVRDEIEAMGGKAIAVECDVAEKAQCDRAVAEAINAFGGLYAAFANAGYGFEGPALLTPDDKVRAIFDTNVFGSLRILRPAAQHMRERQAGHLLMCSSALSKITLPNYSAYSLTKAAQDHLGRALRLELRGTGVFCSTVHPIGTRTEFFENSAKNSEHGGGGSRRFMQPPELVARRVVRCLRRPRGEVWTSLPTRLGLALGVALPGFADWVVGRGK